MMQFQKQYNFWEYMRRGSLYPLYADHCIAWTSLTEDLFGYSASRAVAYFSNDTVFFRVCRDETLQGGLTLIHRFFNDEKGFATFRNYWETIHEALKKWLIKTSGYTSFDVESCAKTLAEFSDLNKKAQAVWSSKEYLDAYLSHNGYTIHGKSFSSCDKELLDKIRTKILSLPPELYKNCSIGNACKNISRAHPDLCQFIADYCAEYAWTGTTYSEVLVKDFSFFINSLFVQAAVPSASGKQETQPAVLREFPHGDILFDLFEERKTLMLNAFYRLHQIYGIIGSQYDLYANQAKWITPDEWLDIVHGDKVIDENMISERMYCSFIDCQDGKLTWDTGEEAYHKESLFRKTYFNTESNVISGEIVFPGTIRGKCIVMKDKINIPDDGNKYVFVTGMTTPDMIPYMDRALAVITDEGGTTCHAAIMCRELKITCIVGTRFATKIFQSGDMVEVSGNTVSLVGHSIPTSQTNPVENSTKEFKKEISISHVTPHMVQLRDVDESIKEEVGNKAYYCRKLKDMGYSVPDGFVIYGTTIDKKSISELVNSLAPSNTLYAVRSSARSEDSHQSSKAGKFKTFLHVSYEKLAETIMQCAEVILSEENSFSVLVQEMVSSEVSGVAFTSDIISSRYDLMLVEAASGVAAVVDGNASPQRYYIKKESGMIERLDVNGTIEPCTNVNFVPKSFARALIRPKELTILTNQLKKIEDDFNHPCDVEWAIDHNGMIWMLQCREIVKNK